jgi:hypothetical protein
VLCAAVVNACTGARGAGQTDTTCVCWPGDTDGVFGREVSKTVTQAHPFYRDMEHSDVSSLASASHCEWICDYFSSSFSSPAEFCLVMVGNIDIPSTTSLLAQYMGSIGVPAAPRDAGCSLRPSCEDVNGLGVTFPSKGLTLRVERPMVQALRSRACVSR